MLSICFQIYHLFLISNSDLFISCILMSISRNSSRLFTFEYMYQLYLFWRWSDFDTLKASNKKKKMGNYKYIFFSINKINKNFKSLDNRSKLVWLMSKEDSTIIKKTGRLYIRKEIYFVHHLISINIFQVLYYF
jgi:hypothetical protein